MMTSHIRQIEIEHFLVVLTNYGVKRADFGSPTRIQKNTLYNLDINTLTAGF